MALPAVVPIFAAIGVWLRVAFRWLLTGWFPTITKTLIFAGGTLAIKATLLRVLSFISGQAFHLVLAYNLGKPIINFILEKVDLIALINSALGSTPSTLTIFWGCFDFQTPLSLLISNQAVLIYYAFIMRRT